MIYRDIKTLQDQVGWVLQQNPDACNSDELLVRLVCEEFNYEPIAKASSIERCRRKWNSTGMYLPTDEEVARKRKLNIDEWRIAMGYPRQERINMVHPNYVPPSEDVIRL